MIAMHLGKLTGSETEMIEPLMELAIAKEKASFGDWWGEGEFGATTIGETIELPMYG